MRALANLRAQHHDVSVLHVLDPHERTFPYEGLTEFRALETGAKLLANPAAIRRDYLARMDAFLAKCRGTLAQAGVDYHRDPHRPAARGHAARAADLARPAAAGGRTEDGMIARSRRSATRPHACRQAR